MFKLPDKPGIEKAEQKADARKYCVLPIRAAHDKTLTRVELRHLMVLSSYASNSGFTFVSISTLAAVHKCSIQNVSRYLQKIERKGYIKTHRKGMTGIRGALRQIVFDETITMQDAIAISNTPIPEPIGYSQRDETMKRKSNKANQRLPNYESDKTPISYQDGILAIQNLIKSESDLLKLERLISQGITRTELLAAFA